MEKYHCPNTRRGKGNFSRIIRVDFGAYIAPQDYFVSYIFKTEEELSNAKETGLLQKINEYHQKLLREQQYPEEGIKNCTFASQEDCDKEWNGNWYYYYK